ncbi:MAG: 50S ribosomal protein L18 [bacterium]
MEARNRRHKRLRYKLVGTPERPRLSVYRSSKYICGQIIDDTAGHTLAYISSAVLKEGTKKVKSKECGKLIAQLALSRGIKKVVFDRGGYQFHGRISEFAIGAREGGLEF